MKKSLLSSVLLILFISSSVFGNIISKEKMFYIEQRNSFERFVRDPNSMNFINSTISSFEKRLGISIDLKVVPYVNGGAVVSPLTKEITVSAAIVGNSPELFKFTLLHEISHILSIGMNVNNRKYDEITADIFATYYMKLWKINISPVVKYFKNLPNRNDKNYISPIKRSKFIADLYERF